MNSADLAKKKIKLELAFQNALRVGNQHVESIFAKKIVDKINKHQSQIVANCWLLTVFQRSEVKLQQRGLGKPRFQNALIVENQQLAYNFTTNL